MCQRGLGKAVNNSRRLCYVVKQDDSNTAREHGRSSLLSSDNYVGRGGVSNKIIAYWAGPLEFEEVNLLFDAMEVTVKTAGANV